MSKDKEVGKDVGSWVSKQSRVSGSNTGWLPRTEEMTWGRSIISKEVGWAHAVRGL